MQDLDTQIELSDNDLNDQKDVNNDDDDIDDSNDGNDIGSQLIDDVITKKSMVSRWRSEGAPIDVPLNDLQLEIMGKTIESSKKPNFTGIILNLPMGFGKTRLMTAIGLKLYHRLIVVCSKTLLVSWINELEDVFGFKMNCDYQVLHKDYLGAAADRWTMPANPKIRIILTTPEMVVSSHHYNRPRLHRQLRESTDADLPAVIVDEFQNYTNYKTQRCQAISSLTCKHRYLLSGTPIPEPKVDRFLGIFMLLNKEYPTTVQECSKMIRSDQFTGLDAYCISVAASPPACQLEEHYKVYTLNKAERRCYRLFRLIIREWHQFYQEQKALLGGNSTTARKIRGNLLSMLTFLRQALVEPAVGINNLVDKVKSQPELKELAKRCDKMLEYTHITSTRFELLTEVADAHLEEKMLVFGCYATCLKSAFRYMVDRRERRVFFLDGQMTSSHRIIVLNKFKESNNGVLFLTYQLGSEGLNLQEASVVIHLDLFWNRHKEDQALARCYRQGQKAAIVHQYYLLSNTGFERGLLMRHKDKMDMVHQVSTGSVTTLRLKGIKFLEMVEMLDHSDIDEAIEARGETSGSPKSPSFIEPDGEVGAAVI